jgi:hypothetical protein
LDSDGERKFVVWEEEVPVHTTNIMCSSHGTNGTQTDTLSFILRKVPLPWRRTFSVSTAAARDL